MKRGELKQLIKKLLQESEVEQAQQEWQGYITSLMKQAWDDGAGSAHDTKTWKMLERERNDFLDDYTEDIQRIIFMIEKGLGAKDQEGNDI